MDGLGKRNIKKFLQVDTGFLATQKVNPMKQPLRLNHAFLITHSIDCVPQSTSHLFINRST